MTTCWNCDAEIAEAAWFCGSCGAEQHAACPDCGSPTRAGASFCSGCGRSLGTSAEIGPFAAAPLAAGTITQRKTVAERKEALAGAIRTQVAQGYRVESQGDFQAVVVKGHRPNHLLHFIIGLVTIGFWWIMWFFIWVFGGEKRAIITVDESGNTMVQRP